MFDDFNDYASGNEKRGSCFYINKAIKFQANVNAYEPIDWGVKEIYSFILEKLMGQCLPMKDWIKLYVIRVEDYSILMRQSIIFS